MNNPLKFSEPPQPGRGRRYTDHIHSFRSGDLDLRQGVFESGGYCSLCGITCPHHHEKVTCAICHRAYHTPCLPDKVGRTTVATLARNPSLWWFCLECLHVSNSADVSRNGSGNVMLNVSDTSSGSNSSFVSESDLQDHLTVMESKIYSRLKSDLNDSLSKITLSNHSSLHSSSSSVNTMFPEFIVTKEPNEPVKLCDKNETSALSNRKFSSSSGFSESQGSSPSERATPQNKQVDLLPASLVNSRKMEVTKIGEPEPSRRTQPFCRADSPRKLTVPGIAKITYAKNFDDSRARALSPNKFELRKMNADHLNEIKNLVQKGRNF